MSLKYTMISDPNEWSTHADLYFDLLNQVASKYPGETRHETAKRYIMECEQSNEAGMEAACTSILPDGASDD